MNEPDRDGLHQRDVFPTGVLTLWVLTLWGRSCGPLGPFFAQQPELLLLVVGAYADVRHRLQV
jgi:hypothetical protein